ncbi:zinc finger, CCHC-type containing protein [Tanacetum coccineum]
MILTTNTPYPSKKIRRIHACTHQRPRRKQAQYAVSREDQYAVLDIWHVNILEDIKCGPYSKKLQYAVSNPLDTPMDDPNITMEEYIRLEEEKARRRAIAFNDSLKSGETLSCEPTTSSLNDEIDFKISFDDSDDEDYTEPSERKDLGDCLFSGILLIMEYLVNISKRRAFWSLNEDILKITILTTNTSYPSRKIRRIRACTHQRPRRKQAQYAVSREDQYAVLDIWHVNILEDIKRGPYSKKLQYAVSNPLDTPFNFHLFPRDELEIGMPYYSFSYQPSYLALMAREDFDFNVCIYDGDASVMLIILHMLKKSKELMDELVIFLLQFDRAGYRESDLNPKRLLKSEASDIEVLADPLQLGCKF